MNRKTIQIVLALALAAAAVRVGLIYWGRHSAAAPQQAVQQRPLQADYYVTPKKLHAYDLQSAKEMTKGPVWVQAGYRHTYYRFDRGTGHTNFAAAMGLLGPVEKLNVVDVVADAPPHSSGEKQVMAVFEKDGQACAFPIGVEAGKQYKIYADEMLYYQDPHELYNHWPKQTWDAIDRHEVKPGMSELQADFAVGVGTPHNVDDDTKIVDYGNGGRPLQVTFERGKVTEVKTGTAPTQSRDRTGDPQVS